MLSIPETLAQAQALHRAGQLQPAAELCRRILSVDPQNADAWHMLGGIAFQTGNQTAAVDCILRAIAANPNVPGFHNNLGLVYHIQQDFASAAPCFRRALALTPDNPQFHNNLGAALSQLAQADQAIGCFRRALDLKPDYAEAYNNLGVALKKCDRLDEAVACYRSALQFKPDYPEVCNNLGNLLKDQRMLADAAAWYRRAAELKPDYAEAHNGLGIVLLDQGNLDESAVSFQRALELKPAYAEAYNGLGSVYVIRRQRDEAMICFDRALQIKPDFADSHWNRSLVLLLQGDFERGWTEYEYRWQTSGFAPRRFEQPLWDGEQLAGKRILLHAEQGLGDTIQFVRYAAQVKQRGGTVILECQQALLPLLSGCANVDQFVGQGNELPDFDVQAPLLSLPRTLHTSLHNVPAEIPYIHAASALIETWRERLGSVAGFKIGIAWQGSTKFRADVYRSIPLRYFAPLAEASGVRLISLQKGAGSEQLADIRFPVLDFGPALDEAAGPLMDTAAIMANLDLVITSDTAIAHLAGALGVPVWVALSCVPDWRWMLDRHDSPWYPTMRLFRQRELGDWAAVFRDIQTALQEKLATDEHRASVVQATEFEEGE